MDVACDRCNRKYEDLFDTVVHVDYVETGRGKPYEYHLCLGCRKDLIRWVENEGWYYLDLMGDDIDKKPSVNLQIPKGDKKIMNPGSDEEKKYIEYLVRKFLLGRFVEKNE